MSSSGDRPNRPATGGARTEPVGVRLAGELDLATIDAVTAALHDAAGDGGHDIVVDMTDVTYMDCETLGAVLRVRDLLAEQRHDLTIRRPHPIVRRLLELCTEESLIERRSSGHNDGASARNALATWIEVPPRPAGEAVVADERAANQPARK